LVLEVPEVLVLLCPAPARWYDGKWEVEAPVDILVPEVVLVLLQQDHRLPILALAVVVVVLLQLVLLLLSVQVLVPVVVLVSVVLVQLAVVLLE
jgi:hypothetical protein